jgi:hypothetical protein
MKVYVKKFKNGLPRRCTPRNDEGDMDCHVAVLLAMTEGNGLPRREVYPRRGLLAMTEGLFPLNSSRRFGRDIVYHPINPFYFINNSI